jgi:ubiquinone/menaquinone biosynthesis C-methylase UbiE
MVPAMFGPFARDLVERLDLHESMRIADVGCGTGIVARMVGEKLNPADSIFGIDINRAMLEVAREKSKSLPCETIWHEASADALPLDDASLDLVVSQHAFMFFPDKPAASREMHRVLRPGGRLYVSAWRHYSRQPHYKALVDGLGRIVSTKAADLMKSAFQFETEDAIRTPLMEGGFQDVRVDTVKMDVRFPSADQFVRIVVAGSILARMGIEIGDEALRELCSDVSNALAQYETALGLVVPMESYLASAVRRMDC